MGAVAPPAAPAPLAWTDWKGAAYTGRGVWEYVNGVATPADCTPGRRDAANGGMMPADFLARANGFVAERSRSLGRPLQSLTLDEVLAVRLYTGPAFQPINGWLREVSCLPAAPPAWMKPRWGAYSDARGGMGARAARRDAACDPSTSLGVTCGHLIAALRKLSACCTADECDRRLFRGLSGVLQGSFWLPDAMGVVCATDAAFMSTSLGEATPVHYMAAAPKPNLLWELRARGEDETGYHCGAEVAMLSQFAAEREVLFPPLTLLRVLPREAAPTAPPPSVRRGASMPASVSPAHGGGGVAVSSGGAKLPAMELVARSRAALQVTSERATDGKGELKEFERVAVVPTFTG